MTIKWERGEPTDQDEKKLYLIVGVPQGGPPNGRDIGKYDICVGHYRKKETGLPGFVRARMRDDSPDRAQNKLTVMFWSEIDLPPGAELRDLTDFTS